MYRHLNKSFLLILLMLTITAVSVDADALKPFILASSDSGTIAGKVEAVKESLVREGFQIVGEYAPYNGAHVIALTSDKLKADAARSELGAYGAVQRVSLTESNGEVQISYMNPFYFAEAYRMDSDPAETASKLEKALGKSVDFGSKKGLSSKKLRKYHYMAMMPYFDDQVKLASFGSHKEAVSTIEKNLAAQTAGNVKVFKIDLPGKDETIFGVGIGEGKGADEKVMKVIDFAELKQTAHLPYDLVVSDGVAYMLHGKFRIALNFPDLKMMTFMKISLAPGGIENSLKKLTDK